MNKSNDRQLKSKKIVSASNSNKKEVAMDSVKSKKRKSKGRHPK